MEIHCVMEHFVQLLCIVLLSLRVASARTGEHVLRKPDSRRPSSRWKRNYPRSRTSRPQWIKVSFGSIQRGRTIQDANDQTMTYVEASMDWGDRSVTLRCRTQWMRVI